MRVFISWSGEPSRELAVALRDWLPRVIQRLDPWVSAVDVGAGTRWGNEVTDALGSTEFGILCVTPANPEAAWLNFEAGAMASRWEDARVCPYLLGMEATELPPGPLTQFQASTADRDGTFDLVRSLNDALPEGALGDDALKDAFEAFWPGLEETLGEIDVEGEVDTEARSSDDMLAELVEGMREIRRAVGRSSAEERERREEERLALLTDFLADATPAPHSEIARALWAAGRKRPHPSLFDTLPGESADATTGAEAAGEDAADDDEGGAEGE